MSDERNANWVQPIGHVVWLILLAWSAGCSNCEVFDDPNRYVLMENGVEHDMIVRRVRCPMSLIQALAVAGKADRVILIDSADSSLSGKKLLGVTPVHRVLDWGGNLPVLRAVANVYKGKEPRWLISNDPIVFAVGLEARTPPDLGVSDLRAVDDPDRAADQTRAELGERVGIPIYLMRAKDLDTKVASLISLPGPAKDWIGVMEDDRKVKVMQGSVRIANLTLPKTLREVIGMHALPPSDRAADAQDEIKGGLVRLLQKPGRVRGSVGYFDKSYEYAKVGGLNVDVRDEMVGRIVDSVARSPEPSKSRALIVEHVGCRNQVLQYAGIAFGRVGDRLPGTTGPAETELEVQKLDDAKWNRLDILAGKVLDCGDVSPFGARQLLHVEDTTVISYFDGRRWRVGVWYCSSLELPADEAEAGRLPKSLNELCRLMVVLDSDCGAREFLQKDQNDLIALILYFVEPAKFVRASATAIVSGLSGTGDGAGDSHPMLRRMVRSDARFAKVTDSEMKNLAVVHVIAEIPFGAKKGDRVTVWLSPVGGATSLREGNLPRTELHSFAIEGLEVVAEGPVDWRYRGNRMEYSIKDGATLLKIPEDLAGAIEKKRRE